MDLEKKLKSQKRTSGFFDVFNALNPINPIIDRKVENDNQFENSKIDQNVEEEMRKLHEEISQLKFENQTYLQKMNDTLEQSENVKLGFKNELKTYTDKVKTLEEEVKMLQDEKSELQDRIKLTSTISSQTLKETEHFKELLVDYKKGKEEAVNKLNAYIEKCNKLNK
jgi:predicted  nucleic acid-binding Zn-ribbon protein